jgi:hypothetical protein
MKLPFFRPKPDDVKSFRERATYVGSAEYAWPIRTGGGTHEQHRELLARRRARRAQGRAGLTPRHG